jgi:phage regulator Rha-like protein
MSDNLLMGILPADIVTFDENQTPITTSLKVAEVFQKEHKHVLRDIREIIESLKSVKHAPMAETSTEPKIGRCGKTAALDDYFRETSYIYENALGKYQQASMFYMNRDGFMLLVMGYTGEKALKFKLAYITAFNAMEAYLRRDDMPRFVMLSELEKYRKEVRAQYDSMTARLKAQYARYERELTDKFNLAVSLEKENVQAKLKELEAQPELTPEAIGSALTAKALSERWGISVSALEHWRRRGAGPAYFKLGSSVRYPIEDVKAFEKTLHRAGGIL